MAPGYLSDFSDTRLQNRRRQNALAQRNYRARQRERKRLLERMAILSLLRPSFQPALDCCPCGDMQRIVRDQAIGTGSLRLNMTASEFFSYIGSSTEPERRNFFLLMTKELFGIRDIIKYGLISQGYPVSVSMYNDALFQPLNLWFRDIRRSLGLGHDEFLAAVKAGIRLFGQLQVPMKGDHHVRIHELHSLNELYEHDMRDMRDVTPMHKIGSLSPPSNSVVFTRISFVSAIFINALLLGISWGDLISFDSESPFCRRIKKLTTEKEKGKRHDKTASTTTSTTTTKNTHSNLGTAIEKRARPTPYPEQPDLMPTHVQTTIPHHPTLDTIPWAGFRSKVISAAHTVPPSIDREDLCLDLMNDGLRCWGFANNGCLPTAAPWDARYWEAAPWFLEKWERLTEGRDGYEWQISSRWWSMETKTNA